MRTPALPASPADALDSVDAEVGDGDIVVGHSMGGVVALRLARERARPLRGIVLTGCFFPPARNGRSLAASIGDYAAHRAAFLRGMDRRSDEGRSPGSARALSSLIRLAVRRDEPVITPPVLVVHARDDHHVPVDFALAAAARHPGWTIEVHEHGGHHMHVDRPEQWLESVRPWLDAL